MQLLPPDHGEDNRRAGDVAAAEVAQHHQAVRRSIVRFAGQLFGKHLTQRYPDATLEIPPELVFPLVELRGLEPRT